MTTATSVIDEAAKTELELYAENDEPLYRMKMAIIANLTRKIERGTYSATLAPKAWLNWYTEAAGRYCREYGGTIRGNGFTMATRRAAAEESAVSEYEAILRDEYKD